MNSKLNCINSRCQMKNMKELSTSILGSNGNYSGIDGPRTRKVSRNQQIKTLWPTLLKNGHRSSKVSSKKVARIRIP